jgi:hypothetical protein
MRAVKKPIVKKKPIKKVSPKPTGRKKPCAKKGRGQKTTTRHDLKGLTPKDQKDAESIAAGKQVMCETRLRMEAADLGLNRGLAKLNQLLESTKPISCIKGKEADGGTVDFVDVPDNQAQCKALDMLLNLGDYYPDKKLKHDVNLKGDLTVNIIDRFGG